MHKFSNRGLFLNKQNNRDIKFCTRNKNNTTSEKHVKLQQLRLNTIKQIDSQQGYKTSMLFKNLDFDGGNSE